MVEQQQQVEGGDEESITGTDDQFQSGRPTRHAAEKSRQQINEMVRAGSVGRVGR